MKPACDRIWPTQISCWGISLSPFTSTDREATIRMVSLIRKKNKLESDRRWENPATISFQMEFPFFEFSQRVSITVMFTLYSPLMPNSHSMNTYWAPVTCQALHWLLEKEDRVIFGPFYDEETEAQRTWAYLAGEKYIIQAWQAKARGFPKPCLLHSIQVHTLPRRSRCPPSHNPSSPAQQKGVNSQCESKGEIRAFCIY